jgi:uncharacterized protein (UPF0332 family)
MTTKDDQELSKRAIQNVLDIFVTPEVTRRQSAGELPKPLKLTFAQVILFPDERKSLVRINEEVKAKAKVRYKSGISKKPDEWVREDEIEAIEYVELGPDDDPDCGYIFLYFKGTTALMWLDLHRNRALATEHIHRAEEFLETAASCMQGGKFAPFVDNLFNATELSAKTLLLVMYDYPPSLRRKSSHSAIQIRYNRFADLGNVIPEYKKVFNRLSGLRTSARYLKGGPLKLTDTEAKEMLDVVDRMTNDAKQQLKSLSDLMSS